MGNRSATLTVALIFSLLASLAPGSPAPAAPGRFAPFAIPLQGMTAPTPSPSPAWSQYGFDTGHSGLNPSEKAIGANNVASLQVAWNDASIVQPTGFIVADGVVYADDQNQPAGSAYALSATTGKQLWTSSIGLNGSWGSFEAVPALAGDVLVSPCSNGSSSDFRTGVCGLNAKTGKVLWSQLCASQGNGCGGVVNGGTSPTVYDGVAYFAMVNAPNEGTDLYAVGAKTGQVVWDIPGVYHCPDGGLGLSHPLPAGNGRLYAVLACQGTQNATDVCAFSATTGATDWCTVWPTAAVDTLIAGEGKVFATAPGSNGTAIIALDESTGAKVWSSTNLPGRVGALAVANQRVFVNNTVSVVALSATNGKTLWTQGQNANYTLGGALSVANGLVYTDGGGGNNGNDALTAINEQTGALVFTSSAGNGSTLGTPVVLGDTVFAGCYTLCAFRLPKSLAR
jgi:outer membrane protein assembly factor BamB